MRWEFHVTFVHMITWLLIFVEKMQSAVVQSPITPDGLTNVSSSWQPRNVSIPADNQTESHERMKRHQISKTGSHSPPTIVGGRSVQPECHPNHDGHRELPCIVDPRLVDLGSSVMGRTNYSRLHGSSITTIDMTFRTGEFAHLPCRTLGVGESDTIIWEKGDAPLFVSNRSFSTDQRFRLITAANKTNIPSPLFPDNREHTINKPNENTKPPHRWSSSPSSSHTSSSSSSSSPTSSFIEEKLSHRSSYHPSNRHSQLTRSEHWDLVISYLQPSDTAIYTCRLVGLTRQWIRYRLTVTEVKPIIVYSRRKLVHITPPTLIQMGQAFNLSCSVRMGQTSVSHIAIDWFRPDHSYDGMIPLTRLMAGETWTSTQGRRGRSRSTRLTYNTDVQVNSSTMIHWLAESFVQMINRPALGMRLFKQLSTDSRFKYHSEAVLQSERASIYDAGLYECRVYEPVNHGKERILDRAIVHLDVYKPYPHQQDSDQSLSKSVVHLLANYWGMLSDDAIGMHEVHAQNDGGIRVPGRQSVPLRNLANYGFYLPQNSNTPKSDSSQSTKRSQPDSSASDVTSEHRSSQRLVVLALTVQSIFTLVCTV